MKNEYKKYSLLMVMLAGVVLTCFSVSSKVFAAAGINKQINFQGKVVNADGTNVTNGSYTFLFCLYTTASPATACTSGANNDAVWRESKSLTVTDGVFQTNLGDTTTLPGSVDFNTDNIYLGINFNSDGQMSPLVRFTAAPYAMNADKVHGLTVTDTTGTLTIPNGTTIAFSGANNTTLTTTGTTNVTLPTTGTLSTLAGSETLTNKTIGSTGLTFSGAATDITTATGESLVIVAAGSGTVDIQDATTVDSLTADTGGVSIAAGQSYTGAGAVTLSSGGTSGLTLDSASGRVSVATGDFLSLSVSGVTGAAAGDIWYDSAAGKFKINEGGSTKILCNTTDLSCGSGASTLQGAYDADTDTGNTTISLTAADDGLVFTNPTSGGTDGSTFLLYLNQQHTTANVSVLDITQSSNAANGVNLTANSIDGETALAITANGLTSGKGITIASSATGFTGALESITLSGSNAANNGNLLLIQDSGALNTTTPFKVTAAGAASQVAALIENTGSGASFRVNDAASDSTPFIIDTNGNVRIGTTGGDDNITLYTLKGGTAVSNGSQPGDMVALFQNNAATSDNASVYVASGTAASAQVVVSAGGYGGNHGEIIADGANSIFKISTNMPTINFYPNGTSTAAVTIDSSSNFGVGDTTPDGRIDYDLSSTATGAATAYGANFTLSDTGVVTTGTDVNYGLGLSVTRTGATGGTITTYGHYTLVSTDNAGAGTSTAYGSYIDTNVAGTTNADTVYGLRIATEANASTTAYGLYVDSGTGAGTEYAAAFMNGAVGIGTATPATGTLLNVTDGTSEARLSYSSGGSTYAVHGSGGDCGSSTCAGIYGTTTSNPNAAAVAGYFTLANAGGTAVIINSSSVTTGKLINLGHDTSAFSGTMIFANAANGSGSFSGNFIDLQKNSVSQFTVTNAGVVTAVGAIAANGGITFDNATDTVGAHTLSGTLDANTNILTNIGNSGTDFVASTGALTLAGILTANGGISLAGSQSFAASALSFVDLGSITYSTTANQGLRLPNAASATPSNPTSGEGYIAWDAAGNQVIVYNGSSWATLTGGGGGYATIQDEGVALTTRTVLNFTGAGVTCADNSGSSRTDCTISGGAGAGNNLQQSYDADADGSNATISLTAADDGLVFTNPTSGGTDASSFLLSLTQQNTTAAVTVLDITQSSDAANAVNVTANAIDTETGLAITTNGLTSGKGISVTSSATSFTGNLADVSLTGSSASNTGNVLAVSNTGTANANTSVFIDHRATGSGNLALRINDQASDITPVIVDGDGRVGIGTTSITGTTERLLQVGSPTNRGNLATYGDIVTKGYKQIQALSNIKDVFIYDTSLDSDGGRWIDWSDTEPQSWYTETLDDSPSVPCDPSTMDRCYAQSFPRKAILVVTTNALYIFDATNGTMWMKFSQNAAGWALGADTNNDPSSVTAMNGVIYVGTNGTAAGGLYVFDFVNDRMWNFDDTDRSAADVGIGSRNSTVTYNSDNNTNFDLGSNTGWKTINDVSATVIQNSQTAVSTTQGPNNAVTVVGLATDSGLTVINLTSQKIRQYSDVTDNDYQAVSVTRNARLYGLNSSLGQLELWINIDLDNLASRINGTPDKVIDENSTPRLSKAAPTISTGAPDALEVIPNGSLADGGILATASIPSNSDLIYVGTNQGLTEIDLANITNATTFTGWSKFYTTTRQTPFLPGTIRRYHPMDDASGNVTNAAQSSIMAAKGTPTYGVEGVRGKAMSFNGTSQYLCSDANSDGTCDNDTTDNINTGGFAITTWFKHSTTAAGVDTLFARCYNATPAAATGCIAAAMNASGQMVFTVDDDALWSIGAATNNDVTYTTTATYNDNQWHFLVLTKTTGATAPVALIDGQVISYATSLTHTTLDNAQILGIGTDCSTGASCSTGGNFWDGAIDDFTYSACGTAGCTTDGLLTTSANAAAVGRLLYNDARPLLNKKVISVTDATTATSTTIGDSGETWIPQEFSGQIVTLTGGTGAGQTRRITSNTATTLTVTPAFTTTPDTTTDFKIDPEALVGSTDTVKAVGVTKAVPIGESRMMCAGTNSGSDTGAVTCFNHQAGPNLVADTYHSDAKYLDDNGTEWTGTNYDNIQSIDLTNRTLIIGTQAHTWTETQDVRLGNALDYLQGKFTDVRTQIQTMGTTTLAGQIGLGVGLVGGADLAENYYSDTPLEAGSVVALDAKNPAYVKETLQAYQKDVLGVVATSPGVVLGDPSNNGYPIALVGRVPVKVTNENGPIYAGDRLTSSSRSGYAMRATQAGRVLGEALSDASDWKVCDGEDVNDMGAPLCTTVMVFVNLTDYYGQSVEVAMAERDATLGADGLDQAAAVDGAEQGIASDSVSIRLATSVPTKQEKILSFLKDLHQKQQEKNQNISEIFAGRIAASGEVITPNLYADQIFAKSIKADTIEGLQIWTDQISSLQEKYAGLDAKTNPDDAQTKDVATQLAVALKNLSVEKLTVKLDGNVLGKLTLAGALSVGGDAEFSGDTVFNKLVTFIGETVFKGKISFEKAPVFGKDTAGFAVIEKGAKKVHITFETPYVKQPIVTVALTNDESPLLDGANKDLKDDIKAVEKEYLDTVFQSDIKYVVTEKSKNGFSIVLSEKAPQDLQFSWVALAVDKVKSFNSEKEIEDTTPVSVSADTPVTSSETTPTPLVDASAAPEETSSTTSAVEEKAVVQEEENTP